jgi:hypothetical protein
VSFTAELYSGPATVPVVTIGSARRDGAEAWVLIHIEVQGQEEAVFPQRMFVYHYRLFDRYNRPVVSLAVLRDDRATWRPEHFALGLWGCETRFTFPVVKLLDYRSRRAELEVSRNPFATVVPAHLTAQETRQDMSERAGQTAPDPPTV